MYHPHWIGWAFLLTGTAFFIAVMLYVEREAWRRRQARSDRAKLASELVAL